MTINININVDGQLQPCPPTNQQGVIDRLTALLTASSDRLQAALDTTKGKR